MRALRLYRKANIRLMSIAEGEERMKEGERFFFVSVASQLPLAQTSFYASVAYFKVAYSATLQGKTVQ